MPQIDRQILEEIELDTHHIAPNRYPRPVISTIDTWDHDTQIDYAHSAPNIGKRPGWNIPSIAVTNESVGTVRSSVSLKTVSPLIASTAGMQADPFTQATAFKPIPNMKQVIRTDSALQITFSIDMTMTTAGHQANFAIFRDSQQISQIFTGSVSTANVPVNVSGSFTDTPTMKQIHVYDLRWKVPTAAQGRVTSPAHRRTFQVSNLRAQ